MLKRVIIILPALLFAFGVLMTSILRTASVKYEFSDNLSKTGSLKVLGDETVNINYTLAFPGKILPDHPLWSIKALRDKLWLSVTTNPSRKAELKLLFADKRVGMSKILFEKENYEIGYSTLTKAEKYLEEASVQEKINRDNGLDTTEFLKGLNYSSLKHIQTIEEIMKIAPDDVKPNLIQVHNYPRSVYEKSMHALNEKGLQAPENPFDRE